MGLFKFTIGLIFFLICRYILIFNFFKLSLNNNIEREKINEAKEDGKNLEDVLVFRNASNWCEIKWKERLLTYPRNDSSFTMSRLTTAAFSIAGNRIDPSSCSSVAEDNLKDLATASTKSQSCIVGDRPAVNSPRKLVCIICRLVSVSHSRFDKTYASFVNAASGVMSNPDITPAY